MSDTASSLSEQIRRRMAEMLGVSPEQLSDATSVGDIPQWDSLMQMIMISSLESEFGLPTSPDNMLQLTSVGKIIACAQSAPGGAAAELLEPGGAAAAPTAGFAAEAEAPHAVAPAAEEAPAPGSSSLSAAIRRRMAEMLGISPEQLSDDTSVGDIPQWDSLMQMIMISSLESEFGLPSSPDNMMQLTSVGKIIACARRSHSSAAPALPVASPAAAPAPPADQEPQRLPIVQVLFRHAAETPAHTALVLESYSLTYAQLADAIRQVAAYLTQRGLRTGDVLALYAEPTKGFFASYFAAHALGITALILDSRLKQASLDSVLAQVEPALIMGAGLQATVAYDDAQLYAAESDAPLPAPPSLEAPADIMFTTGTTGAPKGVLLTQGNLAAAARQINAFVGTGRQDVEVIALPICRSFGLGRLRCVLAAGGTAVLAPGGFSNPAKLFRLLRVYKATGFAMVPAAWAYLHHLSGDSLAMHAPHLRYIELGSAPMPLDTKQRLMQLFPGVRICMHYGLTEASRSTFIEFHAESTRLSTVGRPAPGVDIRICREDGTVLPPGEEGEICICGEHVMQRYLHDTTSFHGAYFRSGDWGKMDTEGYLTLCSRVRDMINVGGKKVSPEEVEALLNTIPGIAESACVPAPDPQGVLGEVVRALLVADPAVPRPSEDRIRTLLSDQLERYKIPFSIEWRPALARTESGKLQRQLMK